jgi:hypothetical protein
MDQRVLIECPRISGQLRAAIHGSSDDETKFVFGCNSCEIAAWVSVDVGDSPETPEGLFETQFTAFHSWVNERVL